MGISSAQTTYQETCTPTESFSKSQVPPFSTEMGLGNITHDEEEGDATTKRKWVGFSDKVDKLLIQLWLNISKDALVGVNQQADGQLKSPMEKIKCDCAKVLWMLQASVQCEAK
ncbi:glutathione S-transferase t2-like protein [Sesbania bispinosa]|nr:glutathione S-transferase t2-like protein [Sesbania bispinosa]